MVQKVSMVMETREVELPPSQYPYFFFFSLSPQLNGTFHVQGGSSSGSTLTAMPGMYVSPRRF